MKTLKQSLNENGIKVRINNKLELAFNEALKDKEFEEFINKLKIDKSILVKYTSLLKKSCSEYSNCKNCKNVLECKNEVNGHAYLPILNKNKLIFNYKACKYQEKIYKDTAHLKNISLYSVSREVIEDVSIKKIYTNDAKRKEVITWIVNFITNYPDCKKGLYLHGNFGCGKSYLLYVMLVELAKKGYKSTIVYWPGFINELKTYFEDNQEFNSIINHLKNTNILFIDDIGAENLTSWSRDEILATILDYRMNNNLLTFFTSNLTLEELTNHFAITKNGEEIVKSKRIMERINKLTVDMQLISKNLRN